MRALACMAPIPVMIILQHYSLLHHQVVEAMKHGNALPLKFVDPSAFYFTSSMTFAWVCQEIKNNLTHSTSTFILCMHPGSISENWFTLLGLVLKAYKLKLPDLTCSILHFLMVPSISNCLGASRGTNTTG